jgi:hypothetical protein
VGELDSTLANLKTLTGDSLTQDPRNLYLYYCRTRAEYAVVEASVLKCDVLRVEEECRGSYVIGQPSRLFGSADTGGGSMGFGFIAYVIIRDWPAAPHWLISGIQRIFIPYNMVSSKGRTVHDLYLLVAKRFLEQRAGIDLKDVFAGRVVGDMSPVLFPDEKKDLKVRLSLEEIEATILIRWLNSRSLLPRLYQELRKGKEPAKALEDVAGMRLRAIERELVTWLRQYPEEKLYTETNDQNVPVQDRKNQNARSEKPTKPFIQID